MQGIGRDAAIVDRISHRHRLTNGPPPPMPSSPISAVHDQPGRTADLLDLLTKVPDPRDPRGVRYAVLAGARSFAAIGEWAPSRPPSFEAPLKMSPPFSVPWSLKNKIPANASRSECGGIQPRARSHRGIGFW